MSFLYNVQETNLYSIKAELNTKFLRYFKVFSTAMCDNLCAIPQFSSIVTIICSLTTSVD